MASRLSRTKTIELIQAKEISDEISKHSYKNNIEMNTNKNGIFAI